MDNQKLFIREFDVPEEGFDSAKKMVKVVPSALWIALLGGGIVIAGFLIWAFFGTLTMTEKIVGFYHPDGSDDGEVICYVPLTTGKMLNEGMEVTMYPAGLDQQEYGHLKGQITYIDPYVTQESDLNELINSDQVTSSMMKSGAGVMVIIQLRPDDDSSNGYHWSNQRGMNFNLQDGTYMNVSVDVDSLRPIDYMIPDFGE